MNLGSGLHLGKVKETHQDSAYVYQGLKAAEVLTLFEYEETTLSDREAKEVSRVSRFLGVEVLKPVVRQGVTCYQARQFIGVLRLGRRTLQILPKIHQSRDRVQSEREASRSLLWMLDYAEDLNIKESEVAALQQAKDWFEVLIYLFASNLRRQWLQAAPRSYESIDATLPVLKGKWQIVAQMRRPEQKHQFSVIYDEFTADNPLSRVFRYVVEALWRLTQNSQNRQMLSELRYWMDEVTLLPVITSETARKIQLTRLNQQYEPLLNLARLFLERLGLQLSASNLAAFGLVFDMNQLFERFVTGFVQRHRSELLPPFLEHCQLLPQGKHVAHYLAQHQGKRVFRLKPDLVFRNGKDYPLLMDFKYKRLAEADRKLGIAEADFYQMYAYLHRFTCSRVLLVYPQTLTLSNAIRARFPLEGSPGEIVAVTINLLRDLSEKSARQALKLEIRSIFEGKYE
jgi:5-methylcytosine-specific restriction enzyme subunit McrC